MLRLILNKVVIILTDVLFAENVNYLLNWQKLLRHISEDLLILFA